MSVSERVVWCGAEETCKSRLKRSEDKSAGSVQLCVGEKFLMTTYL